MDIGLSLEGTCAPGDELLERAAAWLAARGGDPAVRVAIERDGSTALLVAELHPAAEPLLLELLTLGRIRVSARTGTAGPGYHRHACELALGLGEALGVAWELDAASGAGWIADRDDAALEARFVAWLGTIAREVCALADQGKRGFSLFLPAGHAFESAGFVATPLGPRDEAWLRAVAGDPRHGLDVFSWWSAGRDGRYYLELAHVLMWLEVRWRAPLDADERSLLDRACTYVERAHALDGELAIPWAEQSEMLALLSEESLRATRAHLRAQSCDPRAPRIGYRRGLVRVALGAGWSMRVPGELAEKWEERGTWVAWDARRSVWFTSMTVHGDDGRPLPSTESTLASLPPLEGGELLSLERGELRGLACFVEEEREGQLVHRLEAHAAHGADAAIGTIVFVDEADREWALDTWASLVHAAR